MEFDELRAELAKNKILNGFTLSEYGSVRGKKLLQIYRAKWMPCKFNGQPLELHFEIQEDRVLRLDCHWYPYCKFKNLSLAEFENNFPQLAALIEQRNELIREVSSEAEAAHRNNSRLRQKRFNALSGIEWTWDEGCDWRTVAVEIARIVADVAPCVDKRFDGTLSNF